MKVLRLIAVTLSGIFFINNAFSQPGKLQRLIKMLPAVHDTNRINCLNELCEQYIFLLKLDTARIYAKQALDESQTLKYLNGLASVYSLKARIAFKSDDFKQSEKLLRISDSLFVMSSNKQGSHKNIFLNGWIHMVKGDFDEGRNNFEACVQLSKNAHDSDFVFYSIGSLAMIFMNRGAYEQAFEKAMEVRQLALSSSNLEWKTLELGLIGNLYRGIEDYDAALTYFRQSVDLHAIPLMKTNYDDFEELEFAELFIQNHQLDSANFYFNKIDTVNNKYLVRFYYGSKGKYYLSQHHYTAALSYFLTALKDHSHLNDEGQIMAISLSIAKVYLALKKYEIAVSYARKGLALATKFQARHIIRDGYKVLYEVYDRWHQKDSALSYFQKFVSVKDAILADQVRAKLIGYTFDQKIALLNKEKEVQAVKLKQEIQQVNYQKSQQHAQLQKASFLKKLLLCGILILLLVGILVFRQLVIKRKNESHRRLVAENQLNIQKLESESRQVTLLQQKSELEMQVLRAQMNPHFIFNSLNSINRFILQNDKIQASQYLTKFSKLVRLILQNSQAPMISLESELESLQLYLELESVRFENHFHYEILVADDLDISAIKIPPLIIQPYAENAIWHGLMQKEEKGRLGIHLFQKDEILCCKIKDDGIGRYKAAELKSKSASPHVPMGMKITTKRIEMLKKQNQQTAAIKITDMMLADGTPGGTEVLLKIPLNYD